ncbi:MAG: hypothetical protein OJF49_002622 [Ktedonobacterales bacterium]|jgi:hypothetical protein|nr:MAG: hypothetical protein OJF49_002622 [Ktedonobacterales bacterium]
MLDAEKVLDQVWDGIAPAEWYIFWASKTRLRVGWGLLLASTWTPIVIIIFGFVQNRFPSYSVDGAMIGWLILGSLGPSVFAWGTYRQKAKRADELALVLTPAGFVERYWGPTLAARAITYADLRALELAGSVRHPVLMLTHCDGSQEQRPLASLRDFGTPYGIGVLICDAYTRYAAAHEDAPQD